MLLKTHAHRLFASAAVAAVLAISAGGCSHIGAGDTTGSIGSAPIEQADARGSLDALRARYRQNPADPDSAIAYARALRATYQRSHAVAALGQASILHPPSKPFCRTHGLPSGDPAH